MTTSLTHTVPPRVREGRSGSDVAWQGIPGVAETADGTLWVTWYTGGPKEPDAANTVILARSGDGGESWREVAEIVPDGTVRAFDPNLWLDPDGRLWHLWNQSDEGVAELFDGRGGVWARIGEPASDGDIEWSAPRRLSNGVSMNKPVVLADGSWLLPASVWGQGPDQGLDEPREANVYASNDHGATWSYRGGAHVPEGIRTFDEHMVTQLPSGELWMILRTLEGLAESFSQDGGLTWTLVRPSGFNPHTSSRVFLGTLSSGTIVLIRNAHASERTGIAIVTSVDGGRRWGDAVVIDDRAVLTYPDAVELADGRIAVVYDRERGELGEILLRFIRLDANGVVSDVSDTVRVSAK